MKPIATFLISLLLPLGSFFGFSQTKTIEWKSPVMIKNHVGEDQFVLYFSSATHSKETNYLPTYTTVLSNKRVASAVLKNTKFIPLSDTEKKLLDPFFSQVDIIPTVSIGTGSGVAYSYIKFVPIRINPITSLPEKLVSFDISYSFEMLKPSRSLARTESTQQSVLSTGRWAKIAIDRDGVYRIDRNQLASMGFDVASIDPDKIQLYGNGGGMLPQSNKTSRFDDLVENAILVNGSGTGGFNELVFFGQGPHLTSPDYQDSSLTHQLNLYSYYSYYFITVGSNSGKRVQSNPIIATSEQVINTFNGYFFHENDEVNLFESGREWFGEAFSSSTTSRSFSIPLTDLVDNSTISLHSSVVAASVVNSNFVLSLSGNNSPIGNQAIGPITNQTYGVKARMLNSKFKDISTGNNSNPVLTYSFDLNGNGSALGYLNYFSVNYQRYLRLYNGQVQFSSFKSLEKATSTFEVSNANNGTVVWDVSVFHEPKRIIGSVSNSVLSFNDSTNQLKTYVAFDGSNYLSPINIESIGNQNLHGIAVPDLLIVAHPDFMTQANTLAAHRRSFDKLKVEVVPLPLIYNEFSSGKQDLTAIRDFARHLYKQHSAGEGLKYLLLFGDASYDPKNRVSPNTNFIPTYEAYESLDNLYSFSSDDYFGFLDDTEGEWSETGSNDMLDIGIGRLPVQTTKQAEDLVNKYIKYDDEKTSLGKWRNRISFVADDGDGNLHINQANELADGVEAKNPRLNVSKIFLDAYEQVSSAGGETAPQVNRAIDLQIEKGTLILNFTGHGGETGWTQEKILTIPQTEAWRNEEYLPMVVTATCEFGRYDTPKLVSGAEKLLLNPFGGALTMLTTTRPVFASSNYAINTSFYNAVFTPVKDSLMPRVGDVMKGTKNTSILGVNNRNFSLLGDPSAILGYPKYDMVITKSNNTSIQSKQDTLKALSTVTLEGEIRYKSGAVVTDYSGIANITVYDKASRSTTLGNGNNTYSFNTRSSILYEGRASIKNGIYTFSFVVPKDISYQIGAGKISLYATPTTGSNDAAGASLDLSIGGSSSNVTTDENPPSINLYIDDYSFQNGGNTGINPLFIASVNDENGINTTTTGIGHELTAVLDGNQDDIIVLNDFYTADLDTYKSGEVRYPFEKLTPGPHRIEFTAWDTHNNPSTATVEFVVETDITVGLIPNPFSNNTSFTIDQTRLEEPTDITITVYSTQGALLKSINAEFENPENYRIEIPWDGSDDSGNKITPGIYIFRVDLRYKSDGVTVSKHNRLCITN